MPHFVFKKILLASKSVLFTLFKQVSSYLNLFTLLKSGSVQWYLAWGQKNDIIKLWHKYYPNPCPQQNFIMPGDIPMPSVVFSQFNSASIQLSAIQFFQSTLHVTVRCKLHNPVYHNEMKEKFERSKKSKESRWF